MRTECGETSNAVLLGKLVTDTDEACELASRMASRESERRLAGVGYVLSSPSSSLSWKERAARRWRYKTRLGVACCQLMGTACQIQPPITE